MRISDWSSDVCSSDLPFDPSAAYPAALWLAPRAILQPFPDIRGRAPAETLWRGNTHLRSAWPAIAGRRRGQASESAGTARALALVGRPGLDQPGAARRNERGDAGADRLDYPFGRRGKANAGPDPSGDAGLRRPADLPRRPDRKSVV